MKKKILELAEKYVQLISADIAQAEGMQDLDAPAGDVETALADKLIFLSACYQDTPGTPLLSIIEKGAALLVEHIKTNPTSNWSFSNGRSGTIYALLQVWLLTRDNRITTAVLEKIKDADTDFSKSEYVSDFLMDGRAGVLLTLYALYRCTGSAALIPSINHYVTGLLERAHYTDEGLCWKRYEEIILRPSCGMAFGVSGIKYVLSVVNTYFRQSEIDFVINATTRYQQSCWVNELKNWGNYERSIRSARDLEFYTLQYNAGNTGIFEPLDDLNYQSGMTGVLLANYATGGDTGTHKEQLNELLARLQMADLAALGTSLNNGLSGIGICLWMHLPVAANAAGQLSRIAGIIWEKVAANFQNNILDLRLMKGDLGALYFLVKYAGQGTSRENILLPFFDTVFPDAETKGLLDLEAGSTRKKLLAKTFYRSIGILEVSMPHILERYGSLPPGPAGDVTGFAEYLGGILPTLPPNTNTALLADALTFENSKLAFFSREKRNALQFYLDKMVIRDKSLDFLGQPDEWILSCKIGMSDQFTLVNTKRNWSFHKDRQGEKHGLDASQDSEYLIYYAAEMEKVEVRLNFMSIVIRQFDSPRFIGEVINELKGMLQALPKQIVTDYAAIVGSATAADFMARIDYLLLTFIKQMIYDGFLETKNVTYEITI